MSFDQIEKIDGWKGDWSAGERPEGYVRTTDRYRRLHREGFSATKALGPDFVSKFKINMDKAHTGKLSIGDLDELMRNNEIFIGAMDKFENPEK